MTNSSAANRTETDLIEAKRMEASLKNLKKLWVKMFLTVNSKDSLGIINDYVKNHQLGHAKIQLLLSKVTSTVFSSYAKYYQQFKNHAKDLQQGRYHISYFRQLLEE